MTYKELKYLLSDKDVPVLLFNDGLYCEQYGVEELDNTAVLVFDNAVYITMCNTGCSEELEAIKNHYSKHF